MNDTLTIASPSLPLIPAPRCEISVRVGTLDDIPFMDGLCKLHQKMLGFMPRKTFEGKVNAGHVLVAEEVASCQLLVASGEGVSVDGSASSLATSNQQLATPTPVGYCISQDRYMGHDDVGVFYQVNVAPVQHRKLIGATLVKTVFERAAYGCRLYSCWCAQDIEANYFWQSLGFVPLAFRAGNRAKQRVHIFWQRRIRQDDTGPGATPYWFPHETRGGMMNEARLVIPIPPGTTWQDAKPIILPGAQDEIVPTAGVPTAGVPIAGVPIAGVPTAGAKRISGRKPKTTTPTLSSPPTRKGGLTPLRGLSFARPTPPAPVKAKPAPKVRPKNDPRHVAAARELRDRWLEEVNAGRFLPEAKGKYDVSRALEGPLASIVPQLSHSPLSLPLPEAA